MLNFCLNVYLVVLRISIPPLKREIVGTLLNSVPMRWAVIWSLPNMAGGGKMCNFLLFSEDDGGSGWCVVVEALWATVAIGNIMGLKLKSLVPSTSY